MGSRERSIIERVRDNCKAIDGSGSYNYDFTPEGSGLLGVEPATTAPRAPGVYIFPDNVDSKRIRNKTPMNSYSREFVIFADVWVPRSSEQPGDPLLSALDASSDIMRALEADPTCGGITHDVEINARQYDGAQLQLPGYGVASLRIVYEYDEKRGA